MKTEVISMKYRKAEEHAALMVRSCKPGIAYCFEKGDKSYTVDVHFCTSCEKTETKFMNADEICRISHL